ncbi:MAG: hypothetical protein ACKO9I_14380 [Sphaerospermopsis kisseleviana]
MSCRNVAARVGVLLALALHVQPVDARPQAAVRASAVVQNGIDVDQSVTRFLATREDYEKTFRNLVAEETKIIEVYQASGKVEKRRQIVSDLLVYHSSRDGSDATVEYRDVRSMDGKAVERRGERALKLLMNASKADSLKKELEAIKRETRRYEFNRHLEGFTIVQGGGWLKQSRGAFRVQWAGREQVAGHDVVVLDYEQTAPIPNAISVRLPKEFGKPSALSRGRIWLDAETGQLWRDVWEITVRHPATPDPLVLAHRESTYKPSDFGILVPERIVFDWLLRFSHPKNGRPSFALSERTTFTYGSFKRFEVTTFERVKLAEEHDR